MSIKENTRRNFGYVNKRKYNVVKIVLLGVSQIEKVGQPRKLANGLESTIPPREPINILHKKTTKL